MLFINKNEIASWKSDKLCDALRVTTGDLQLEICQTEKAIAEQAHLREINTA